MSEQLHRFYAPLGWSECGEMAFGIIEAPVPITRKVLRRAAEQLATLARYCEEDERRTINGQLRTQRKRRLVLRRRTS